MDACGMNEFKEISLTAGQELRPVSDLHQISALHSHHSSLKPEGFATAQLLILPHQKASACQLQEGKKCYLHSRTLAHLKKITSWLFTCPQALLPSVCLAGETPLAAPLKLHVGVTCKNIFCLYFSCCSSVMGLELTHGKRAQL